MEVDVRRAVPGWELACDIQARGRECRAFTAASFKRTCRLFWLVAAKHRLARHEDLGAGLDDLPDRSADRCRHRLRSGAVLPTLSSRRRTARIFSEAARDERLSAKAGVDRHHQHEIHVASHFLDRDDRC